MLRKLAAALAAPLLFLSACATAADRPGPDVGAGPDSAALVALRAAPALAAEAGTARFEMTFSYATPDGPVEMVATGAYDAARFAMELDVAALLEGVAGSVDEAVPQGFDEPMEMVLAGGTAYLRLPLLESLTGVSGWLSADAGDLDGRADALGLAGTATHPAHLLEVLRGLADDLDERGSELVRGVPTTRYQGTVELDDVLDAVPPGERRGLQAELEGLMSLGGRSVPVEVWIDADGLVRRMQMRFDHLGEEAGTFDVAGSATMTLDLFDVGEPVDIAVPGPDEVTPLSEVLAGAGG